MLQIRSWFSHDLANQLPHKVLWFGQQDCLPHFHVSREQQLLMVMHLQDVLFLTVYLVEYNFGLVSYWYLFAPVNLKTFWNHKTAISTECFYRHMRHVFVCRDGIVRKCSHQLTNLWHNHQFYQLHHDNIAHKPPGLSPTFFLYLYLPHDAFFLCLTTNQLNSEFLASVHLLFCLRLSAPSHSLGLFSLSL